MLNVSENLEFTRESVFSAESRTGETIGRLEIDWDKWDTHAVQLGGEGVFNFAESASTFRLDAGDGPEEIPIAGANTRVSESRVEFFIFDSWTISPRLTIDTGFLFEVSKIKQVGDFENERKFYYPKPSLLAAYSLNEKMQLRFRFEREVEQLEFFEFVSAANIDDDDIDFGNPELRPERTWAAEAVIEHRFGDIGVVSGAIFFDRINDVQDFLPLGGGFEIPGNIGDGTRWGGEIEATVPATWFGLVNARLDGAVAVQGSRVIDPVTGNNRILSGEIAWSYSLAFRHDLPALGVSWGWAFSDSAEETSFGLDEIVTTNEGVEFGAVIETTRIAGVKARLAFGNILNKREVRDRFVFTNERDLSLLAFSEIRERRRGFDAQLTLSGVF